MSELKEYTTTVNGTETTLVLSDEDAQAQGLSGGKSRKDVHEVPEINRDQAEGSDKAASAPANKARTSPNK